MAETLKLNLPNEVIDSEWRDDVDVEYATYGDEKQERQYISPESVNKESIKRIKNRKIGHLALFGKL